MLEFVEFLLLLFGRVALIRAESSVTLRLLIRFELFSKTGSDTFRSVLIYAKEQESRKKNFITVQ